MALTVERRRALGIRLVVAPLLLCAVGLIYWIDTSHGGDGRWSAALLGLLGLAGVGEYRAMTRGAGLPVAGLPLLVAAALLHLAPFRDAPLLGHRLVAPMVLLLALCFATAVHSFGRQRTEQGPERLGGTLLGFVLVSIPLYLGQTLALQSPQAVLYVVLCSKGGDIGGYLAGTALGRHKLCPQVSPGKSVEGAVGSAAVSCLLAVLLAEPLIPLETAMVAGWQLAILGLLLNVATQCGDLVESLLKRRCGIKDSSRLLPEHGGVLDLVDSLLFSVPLFYFVFQSLP
ncbi:MAG: phosphatidate cytidylyltransferase [Planctomycetota bacterium]